MWTRLLPLSLLLCRPCQALCGGSCIERPRRRGARGCWLAVSSQACSGGEERPWRMAQVAWVQLRAGACAVRGGAQAGVFAACRGRRKRWPGRARLIPPTQPAPAPHPAPQDTDTDNRHTGRQQTGLLHRTAVSLGTMARRRALGLALVALALSPALAAWPRLEPSLMAQRSSTV
jgi:hypothetical protein